MASANKSTVASGPRRKSSKPTLMVKLKLSPDQLRKIEPVALASVNEESPPKEESSPLSSTLPVATSTNGENQGESNSNTPAATGTPVSSSMPPPTEVVKKKGVKRGAGPVLGPDGLPRPRGKPGPKKKARLEDGSIDHSSTAPRAANGTAHKLGPKANQGAINAGLRALDRSGKPCRKWAKGSMRLKSFTGVFWEIPRWTAPPKFKIEGNIEASASASGESSKENKDNSQRDSEKSEKSHVLDMEMHNTGNLVSSPASSMPPSSAPADEVPAPADTTHAPVAAPAVAASA